MDTTFRKLVRGLIPTVKADDDELVDPQAVLREKCAEEEEAITLKEKYETCNARVLGKKKTTEICAEELLDFLHVIDHCVTKSLFSKLK